MINIEILYKRLAQIKQLFNIGIEQSHKSESIAVFSLLAFHDSIEMFLKLLAEHKGLNSANYSFMEYWAKIPTLTLSESMRNLNARRVNLKHKGLLPAKSEIEISRVNSIDFFQQNTIVQFNIEFNDISLIKLVSYEKVREYLEISQKSLGKQNSKICIKNVAYAFDELLYIYEENKGHWHSPFSFGKDMSFRNSNFMGLSNTKFKELNELGKFVNEVNDSLKNIKKAIKIISLGLDYKEFIMFDFLTPEVTRWDKGQLDSYIGVERNWNEENCQFCIDFVVKSALKLQDFDFDIRSLELLKKDND